MPLDQAQRLTTSKHTLNEGHFSLEAGGQCDEAAR